MGLEKSHNESQLAYLLFIAIGVGYLFPFSALTQPIDYWTLLFPQFNIEYTITNTYLWVNLISIAALVFFGGEPIYKRRIYGGFIGQLAVLFLVPTSYFFHLSENVNYWVVVSCTAIAAIVTALIDSCAISFAAQVRWMKLHTFAYLIQCFASVSSVYSSRISGGNWSQHVHWICVPNIYQSRLSI